MHSYDFILPEILECCQFTLNIPTASYDIRDRTVYNYELDYNLSGRRTMRLNGKFYDVTEGSLVCRRPGQRAASIGDYDMYMMTLDFSSSAEPVNKVRQHSNIIQPVYDSYMWDIIPPVFEPSHGNEILSYYKKLSKIWIQPERTTETRHTLMALLHLIIADAYQNDYINNSKDSQADKLIDYMQCNYQKKITLDELAAYLHLNKSYLIRLFKHETGKTPIEYLNELRLSQAKKMLVNSNCTVSEISSLCGFENTAYFISCFRGRFQITPDSYRKKSHQI